MNNSPPHRLPAVALNKLEKISRRWLGEFPAIPIAIILAIFLLINFLFLSISKISPTSYHNWSIALEIIKSLPGNIPALALSTILSVALIMRHRHASRSWHQWKHGSIIRPLIIVAASLLVWPYSCYEFNHYFGQWHYSDRLLLVLLYLGIWWKPIFVIPFVPLGIAIAGQLAHPIGGHSWAAPDQAFHLLILFSAFILYSSVSRRDGSRAFLFLAACFIVLHYWPSGFVKLWRNWITHDQIHLLLPNSHINGWLQSQSQETIATWTSLLSTFGPALKTFTLAAECGCLLFFWKRPLALALIAAWILFHTGVFLVSGICFWQWIVLDATLFLLLWKFPTAWKTPGFTKIGFVAAFCLIATSIVWLRPVSLTWFDSSATYSYRFIGISDDGSQHHLPPAFFAPYDYPFAIGGFHYLSEKKTLGITLGATTKDLAQRISDARSPSELLKIESESGRSHLMSKRSQRFATFLTRFAQSVNQDPKNNTWPTTFAAPHLLQTSGDHTTYRYDKPLRRIDVIEIFSYFDGQKSIEIRRRPILQVEIPSPATH